MLKATSTTHGTTTMPDERDALVTAEIVTLGLLHDWHTLVREQQAYYERGQAKLWRQKVRAYRELAATANEIAGTIVTLRAVNEAA